MTSENQLPEEITKNEPRVAQIKEMTEPTPEAKVQTTREEQPTANPEPLSQATPQESVQPSPTTLEKLPPNKLNPSGNPLLFPTKPDEVQTTVRQAITLDQAIAIALQNNLSLNIRGLDGLSRPGQQTRGLQEARIALETEKAELEREKAALFPTIDIQASTVRFRNDRSVGDTVQEQVQDQVGARTFTDLRARATLNYDIYTGGERSAEIAKAQRQIRLQELILEQATEETRYLTTQAYYNLQDADAQVAIAQADVENASQTLRDARLLEQAGLGTRFDVLRGEADLARANQELTRRIAAQRTARRTLAEILGVGQHVQLTAADEIIESGTWEMSLEETIVRAYKNRAELEQELVQKEIHEQDREIALSDIRPQVDFLADYEAREDLDDGTPVLTDWTFQARVRWRIFDGGQAFARATRAERQMDRADSNFAQQRNAIRREVEEGYYNLISNQENIASTRINVQRDEESLRLARLRFQAGVGTQTDVINAQRDLSRSRGDFLQAIIEYNQSLNRLQRSVSNLPDDNLFEVP
ncbi:MAG TPA: transporter [Cyanothece sp. UBA12306]|nr:transporter [Cyanothece sp. UBA12306]